MAFKPIQIVINAKDNASAVFGRLESKVKAVGVAILGYLGVKAFASGIQGAADFEAAMSRVKAATDGTAEEMQALTKAAQDAGANTKYTSIEAAGALENLAKAGLSAGDSIKALPAVLSLAQAGDIGLAEASEFVTKSVMGMGDAFDQAQRHADVLAKGANATNTSVTGLAQALSYAAPVATSLGLSLESTVAMIGKFADAGIDASRAGTALNSILSQFSNPASKFRQELGAAGIVTTDFDKALRELAAKGPDGARAINAVGMEAGPALRALLNQGMGALDELTSKLKEAGGSADATAKTMADNLAGSVKSLGSVWDAAVQVLNTPVLPVLRKGVDELTASIRSAIADGTVAKFGQVLATAFEQGLKYFREFAANVNFDAVVLRLRVFASETQETLQRIGMYATNAGNTVQLAWGVMTAGVQGVLTAIYGLGAAFSEVAAKCMQGLAVLREGLAAVSFGGLSEAFKLAAEDARLAAQAFGDAADAFKAKAAESLQGMADGAESARAGWAGLTGAAQDAQAQLPALAQAVEEVTAKIDASAQASTRATAAAQAKTEADRKAAESVKLLRDEYAALIDDGNLQEAAKRLLEIDRIQRGLSNSGKDAAEAAKLIDQAYADLGLTTNEELQRLATQSKAAFERLAKDGTQPPQRIAEAWKVMAERTIAANAGIAPSWLKAQASAQDYEVTVDKAGQATLKLKDATEKSANAHDRAARSIRGHMTELEKLNAQREREIAMQEKANQLKERELELYQKKWNIDKEGFSLNTAGDRAGMTALSRTAVLQMAKQQGLEDAIALRIVDSFGDRYESKPGLLGGLQGGIGMNEVNKAIADAVLQQARHKAVATKGSAAPYAGLLDKANAPAQVLPDSQAQLTAVASSPQPTTAQVQVFRHEIILGGRTLGAVDTDAAGSNVLKNFMDELERGALMAGGVH